MIQALLLLALLGGAGESADGGGLGDRLPDNTFLVVSCNPRALAGSPAFAAIKKNFLRAADLAKPIAELESIAGIRFFSDVNEITLVVPADVHLRKNHMVLIRGDLRLGGLLELAAAKGMGIEDSDAARGCILSFPGRDDLAAGILEDGSVMIAARKTIEACGAVRENPREGRLDPGMNSALSAADWESMIWGALVMPAHFSAAAAAGTGLPVGHVARAHFRVDAAYDFFVDIRIELKETMRPEAFIETVSKELGIENEAEGSGSGADGTGKKAGKQKEKAEQKESSGAWLLDSFRMAPAGEDGVSISFKVSAQKANEFLGSLKIGPLNR
jgi:hypothetical protein